jgi:hypothetical protein
MTEHFAVPCWIKDRQGFIQMKRRYTYNLSTIISTLIYVMSGILARCGLDRHAVQPGLVVDRIVVSEEYFKCRLNRKCRGTFFDCYNVAVCS